MSNAARLGLLIALTTRCGGRLATAPDNPVCAVPVVEISHTCARKADGNIWCWGRQQPGPDGVFKDRPFPVHVNLDGARAIRAFLPHASACALVADGSVWCWGNAAGETLERETFPTKITAFGTDNIELFVGAHDDCVRKIDRTIWCRSPREVAPLKTIATRVLQLSLGLFHNCAVTTDGKVWCWGDLSGWTDPAVTAIPNAARHFVTEPIELKGIDEAVEVATGSNACARRKDHTVWCWGYNAPYSQFVELGTDVTQLTLNPVHMCARKTDGTAWCWGMGPRGDGTTVHGGPIKVDALGSTVIDLSAGWATICALRSDGTVWCWGDNAKGDVGDGTTAGVGCYSIAEPSDFKGRCRTTPVQVTGLCQ